MGIDRGTIALFFGTTFLATSCGLFPPDFKSLAAAADVDSASLVIRDRVAYGTRLHGDELSVVAFDAAGNVVVVGSRRTDRRGRTVAIGGEGCAMIASIRCSSVELDEAFLAAILSVQRGT